MNVIVPTTITDTNLIASNVPENQYTEWANGDFVTLGTTSRNWKAICRSSSDTLWACVYGGDIYYSTDEGVTWTAYSAGSKDWNGICARGADIYASVYNGSIWKLTGETGSFTDLEQTTRYWGGMSVCNDGHVWCVVWDTTIGVYKQTDGTDDFAADQTGIGSKVSNAPYYMCSSPSGAQYVSIYSNTGNYYIYYRASNSGAFSDLGATVWPTSRKCRGLCSDSNGNIYCTTDAGDIYVRTAGAGNFTALSQTSRAWRGLCADGNDSIYACCYGGSLYKMDGDYSFDTDDYCQITTGGYHRVYQSTIDNNRGNDPLTDTTNWTYIGATNRWKAFDNVLSDQVSVAPDTIGSITYILQGRALTLPYYPLTSLENSVAVLNNESSTIRILEIERDNDLIVTNNWTGATGTTQPTGWDKVGTPSDFTIESDNSLKITADADGEGISKTVTIEAATKYQLIVLYKMAAAGSAETPELAVYDVTHSADILATTAIYNGNEYGEFYPAIYIFTTPADCTSIKISLTVKTSGKSVYFDNCWLAEVIYDHTITTGITITDSTDLDVVQSAASPFVTIIVAPPTGSYQARVGQIIYGCQKDIGGHAPSAGLSWGIKDWSTIEPDTYGHYSIVEREQSKWMKGSVEIPDTDFDDISNFLTVYTHEYLMWIGSETNQCQMIYGICDDWSFQQDEYNHAVLNFSIAGLI